jgi:oligo-1,6-glucosidase
MIKTWWKEAVVYQIYPRSFKDSNADGIGDIKGITSKLDYLKDLGVDVIWMSPHYPSPNADNGYDVSDYEAIMAEFGTMEDFDEMLAGIHQRGMKLIIDLVINHSSDEHYWFQQSRLSKDNPYRDYYIWKKPIEAKETGFINNWISFFSGNAWELDKLTQEYYLHLFLKKQPDLNWENPKLRHEIYKMMRFWLDKGVNGFRMDVISVISKDQSFPDFPEGRFGDLSFYANGPRVHEFLREMNQEVLSHYDCMTVGEAFGVNAEEAALYTANNRHELDTIYHFNHAVNRAEHCFLNPDPEFKLNELKAIFKKWDKVTEQGGWNSIYWGNHDNPRIVSRFGDTQKYHSHSAKMLATILLTLRGTAYIYQGDELGMTNCDFKSIEEYNDVQVLNAYQALVPTDKEGVMLSKQFLKVSNQIARDHARTPMQWNDQAQAGFTDGSKAWFKVNPNYRKINIQKQENNPDSILNYYKKMIQIRKKNLTLVYGDYLDLRPRCNKIWLYVRQDIEHKYLIMNNFTAQKQEFEVKFKMTHKELLIANQEVKNDKSNQRFRLKPYESRIYRIEEITNL